MNIQLKFLHLVPYWLKQLFFFLVFVSLNPYNSLAFRPAPKAPKVPSVNKVKPVSFPKLSRLPVSTSWSGLSKKSPIAPRAPIPKFVRLVKRPIAPQRPKPVRIPPRVKRTPPPQRVPFVRQVPTRN